MYIPKEWTKDANNEALPLFQRAIEFDPNFASAYAMAARCYSQRMTSGWMTDRARNRRRACVVLLSSIHTSRTITKC